MLNQQTRWLPCDDLKIWRWAVCGILMWAALALNHASAQTCNPSATTLTNIQTVVPTMAFTSGSQSKTIGTYSAQINFDGCSGYNSTNAASVIVFLPVHFSAVVPSSFQVTGNKVIFSEHVQCIFAGNCTDSTSASRISSKIQITGVAHELTVEVNGLNASSTQCVSSLSNVSFSQGGSTILAGQFTMRSFKANLSSACTKISIKLTGKFQQTASFYLSSVEKISLANSPLTSPNFQSFIGFVVQTRKVDTFNLFSSPAVMTTQSGTCSLSLSSSTITFGNILLDNVKAMNTPGQVIATKPLTLTISNCSGPAAVGKSKVLQWAFAAPSADSTQMTNLSTGSTNSTGISAQILADKKFDLNGSELTTKVIKSGELYVTSGQKSDTQTLNYNVQLVRNSETVQAGLFNTTATVILSYN